MELIARHLSKRYAYTDSIFKLLKKIFKKEYEFSLPETIQQYSKRLWYTQQKNCLEQDVHFNFFQT